MLFFIRRTPTTIVQVLKGGLITQVHVKAVYLELYEHTNLFTSLQLTAW